MNESFGNLKQEMKDEIKKLEGTIGYITHEVKQINDKVVVTENKTEEMVKRKTRDRVLQQHFVEGLKIDNKDVIILNEIPSRLLCKRKEYLLLAQKLSQKKTFIDGTFLEDVIFTFKQQRFKPLSSESKKFLGNK